jgi:xylulokinase
MPTENHKYVIAVDLGTSGPKVALATTDGTILAYEYEETGFYLLPNGGAEQDPGEWWAAIRTATRRLLENNPVPGEAIIGLCCTTQWSGTVAVGRDGKHLMPAIIWMDSRGAEHIKPVVEGPLNIEGYGVHKLLYWIRLTGGIPQHSGKDSIAHILYIKYEHPEIYRETYKFLEPKDYLNLRLTGRFAASFDSIALHWVTDNRDPDNITYHDRLIRMCGMERDKLPDLKQAVDILGPLTPEAAQELGLGEHVQVIMGMPDLHSAAIGSGAVRDYETHLYIGTSDWITCHVPFKKTDVLNNIASLPSAIPGRYFIINEQETAGGALAFLKKNILLPDDELNSDNNHENIYPIFDRIVERTPAGSDHLIFTPWLNGERTPIDDHTVRGGFHNLSLSHDRSHLIRAVFEGVAYNTRWLFGYVEKFVSRQIASLNMIGGGAKSDVWCQIHADVLNRTIRQVKDPILANARGAVFLALVALGHLSFDDIPDRVEIQNTYTPDASNRAVYDELYAEFLNIYKSNRKIHARLNRFR